jgi:hypothetical protein
MRDDPKCKTAGLDRPGRRRALGVSRGRRCPRRDRPAPGYELGMPPARGTQCLQGENGRDGRNERRQSRDSRICALLNTGTLKPRAHRLRHWRRDRRAQCVGGDLAAGDRIRVASVGFARVAAQGRDHEHPGYEEERGDRARASGHMPASLVEITTQLEVATHQFARTTTKSERMSAKADLARSLGTLPR